MRRNRLTTVVSLMLGAVALVPVSANANPLLSGYGGPGEGSQAILGSALLNGPSAGGGPSSGGSGLSGEGVAGVPASATPTSLAGDDGGAGARGPNRASGHGRAQDGSTVGAARGSTRASSLSAVRQHAGTSVVPVVSGADLLDILLALGLLALTAVLTRALAQRATWKRASG